MSQHGLSHCAADRPDQVMDEVSSCLRMLDEVYAVFGLTYKAALSTRPDSYLGTLEQWDAAEGALKQALDATGKGWEVCDTFVKHARSFCSKIPTPAFPYREVNCVHIV